MTINALFFGVLSDAVGVREKKFSSIHSSKEFVEHIKNEFPEVAKNSFQVAVNETLIHSSTPLKDGDTIALLPNYAGG
jgi:MoaE-MoaD fusion protein